jgi:telomerase reverse transcriptase
MWRKLQKLDLSNEGIMTQKRKRSRPEQSAASWNKRLRLSVPKPSKDGLVQKSLLSQYYSEVLTLREYLLSKLPASSKVRRKKIASVSCREQRAGVDETEREDFSLASYLDQTLVGVPEGIEIPKDERRKHWTSFSQRADNSESTVRSGDGDGECSQCEVRIPEFAREECRRTPGNKR